MFEYHSEIDTYASIPINKIIQYVYYIRKIRLKSSYESEYDKDIQYIKTIQFVK